MPTCELAPLLAADRPRRRAGPIEQHLRPPILLRLRRSGRIAGTADRGPSAVVELVLAAVGAAAADGVRVAARLAGRDGLELRRGRTGLCRESALASTRTLASLRAKRRPALVTCQGAR